ncbi:hypothetical protein PG990_007582 [Apiospora arundinis]
MDGDSLQFDTSGQQPLAVLRFRSLTNGTTFDLYIGLSSYKWAALYHKWPCWCVLKDANPERSPKGAFRDFLERTPPQELESFTCAHIHKGIRVEIGTARGLPNLTKDSWESEDISTSQWFKELYKPCICQTWRAAFGRLRGLEYRTSRFLADSRAPIHDKHLELTRMAYSANIADVSFTTGCENAREEGIFQRHSTQLLVKACIQNDLFAISEIQSGKFNTLLVETQTLVSSTDSRRVSVTNQFDEAGNAIFDGFRPLHWAVASGSMDTTRLLCDHKANTSSKTTYGWTPLHIALMVNNMDIIQFFLRPWYINWDLPHSAVDTPLHMAAAYVSSARHWSNKKYNSLNETPLHRAAVMGNLESAQAILHLDEELEIDVLDMENRTPLWHAAAAGSAKIIDLLLRHGADRDATDKLNRTPLHAACRGTHREAVKALLTAGVKPSYPAVQMACLTGSTNNLEKLLCHRTRDMRYLSTLPELNPWVSRYDMDTTRLWSICFTEIIREQSLTPPAPTRQIGLEFLCFGIPEGSRPSLFTGSSR